MNTKMIVLLCLSALFPVLMGTDEVKYDFLRSKDCSDIYTSGYRSSGVYTISTVDGPVQVYCEMESGEQNDRGHWTVIVRRMNGEVNFARPWRSYKWGFGNYEGEYWLGLEFIHQLTRNNKYTLRADFEDLQGKKAYALYESFSVDSEADGYRLHVSGFIDGGAGDSLKYHNGMKFSTFDKDQDLFTYNCAMKYNQGGGFWLRDCFETNPTGLYLWEKISEQTVHGVSWYTWKNSWDPLKAITIKIRRVK